MNELAAELPAAGVVRVVGPEEAGAGFLVSASGLIVTCAHVLAGCAPGATVSIEPHVGRRSLAAIVGLLQDPPDVAVLRLIAPVPPEVVALPLGRSPKSPQPGLRTFGYPQVRPEAGLPGELAFFGVTAAAGYDQLALRSEEATLGFSGAPIWDPDLGVVVGMVKSIARGDPGQRLGTTAIGVPAEVIRDLCPELRLPAGCPYRGLEPFTEEHVDYYYGRERTTSQLITSLAARDFVPVVAVSGAGKSSLLQAGLAKGLRDRPVVGLAQRIRCYQRVSSQPHAELLQSLAQHGMLLPRELAAAPAPELAAAISAAAPRAEVIVMVDQFERLYTDCEDAERKRFVALLRCLATEKVKVVIGLRADFYHLALADLGEQLAAGQVALAPMSEQDLGQAIAAPAAKLLRSFQPGLTQRLIADVRGRPGDLPLLQFALTELWERDAAGGVLTEETYRGLGVDLPDGTRLPGAQGALIRRAEQLWQDLGPDDRPRLQRILLGLIAAQPAEASAASPVAGTRDLGRPARLAQWDQDDQRLIQRLIDARLLTADKAAAGGQPTVEVSHEALLRAWPRLRNWLKERSKFVQWRAQDLAPNLERWLDSNKDREFLLPRSLLDPALRWLHDNPDELAGPPAGYIQASKRRRTRRRSLITGAVAVLVAASLAAAGIFYSLQQTAVQRQNIAISGLLASESEALGNANATVSQMESLIAWGVYPSDQARHAILAAAASPETATFTSSDGGVDSVAFSPDGKVLATGDFGGTARLWNVATGRQIASLPAGPGAVGSVAFSPDGKVLATGAYKTARLWNVATGRQIASLPAGSDAVDSVVFSPGGKTLATGDDDGTVRLWNVATRRQFASFRASSQYLGSVAFSPDGKTLATGDFGGTARLWNVATRRQFASFRASSQYLDSVAFSPDGKTLATGDNGGTARLWNLATGRQIASLRVSSKGVNSVAFSPGGNILAIGNEDSTVWLFNPATRQVVGGYLTSGTSSDGINSVAISPDGKTLATGDRAGAARLWNLTIACQIAGLPVGSAYVDSVAFSPDGKTLATTDADGAAQLWDPATGRQIARLLAGSQQINSVAFSPDGKTLATGEYKTARLWNLATSRQIASLPAGSQNPPIHSVAFSPDGKTLATGDNGGTARLWNLATSRQIASLPGGSQQINSVAFSPDGKTLATDGSAGVARLWDLATGRQIASLGAGPGTIYSVAFSPDGKTLATGDADGTARLWDPATGRQVGSALPTGSGGVGSVAFSPDGKTLATGDMDATVRLWNLATSRQIASFFTGSGGVSSMAFSPDGKTLATGDQNGMARLWNVSYLSDALARLCSQVGDSLTRTEWAHYVQTGPAYRNVCGRHS
jgi:WD40 repeat protein